MVETLQEFSAALRLKAKVFIEGCGVLCDQALPRPHLSDLISFFLGPPQSSQQWSPLQFPPSGTLLPLDIHLAYFRYWSSIRLNIFSQQGHNSLQRSQSHLPLFSCFRSTYQLLYNLLT